MPTLLTSRPPKLESVPFCFVICDASKANHFFRPLDDFQAAFSFHAQALCQAAGQRSFSLTDGDIENGCNLLIFARLFFKSGGVYG